MANDLVNQIIKGTGLPEDAIKKEFVSLLEKAGVSDDSATIDQIREILANYLQDVLLEAKEAVEEEADPLDCA